MDIVWGSSTSMSWIHSRLRVVIKRTETIRPPSQDQLKMLLYLQVTKMVSMLLALKACDKLNWILVLELINVRVPHLRIVGTFAPYTTYFWNIARSPNNRYFFGEKTSCCGAHQRFPDWWNHVQTPRQGVNMHYGQQLLLRRSQHQDW